VMLALALARAGQADRRTVGQTVGRTDGRADTDAH
jgi:hypothetical protein